MDDKFIATLAPDAEEPIDIVFGIERQQWRYRFQVPNSIHVPSDGSAAHRIHPVELLQLHQPDRSSKVVHIVFVAEYGDFVKPVAGVNRSRVGVTGGTLPGIFIDADPAVCAQRINQVLVVGANHPTVTRGHAFLFLEAEASDIAPHAEPFAFKDASGYMRTILNDGKFF